MTSRLRLPVWSLWACRPLRWLPVLAQDVARRAWGLRQRGVGEGRAVSPLAVWPAAEVEPRRHPEGGFSTCHSPACRCPSPRCDGHLAVSTAGPGVRMARDAFPGALLPSRLPAGVSRRYRLCTISDTCQTICSRQFKSHRGVFARFGAQKSMSKNRALPRNCVTRQPRAVCKLL
jgi:hypothetical protein